MHRLTEKLTALEYAVAFLLEREERKLMAKPAHTPEDLQDLARLEDLRAELQLHMTEKPEKPDIMCPLCRKVELVPEVPIIGLNPDPVRPLICNTCADNIRAEYAEQMEEERGVPDNALMAASIPVDLLEDAEGDALKLRARGFATGVVGEKLLVSRNGKRVVHEVLPSEPVPAMAYYIGASQAFLLTTAKGADRVAVIVEGGPNQRVHASRL